MKWGKMFLILLALIVMNKAIKVTLVESNNKVQLSSFHINLSFYPGNPEIMSGKIRFSSKLDRAVNRACYLMSPLTVKLNKRVAAHL